MDVWEIIGWAGTVIYVLAYLLLAVRVLPAGRVFYASNIVAALLVVLVSIAKGSTQAVAINALWAVASIFALSKKGVPLFGLRPPAARFAVAALVGGGLILLPWQGLPPAASWMAWGSVVGYIAGYILFVGKRIAALEFHIFNLIAAAAILPALVLAANWPVVALEAIWGATALAGIVSDLAVSRRTPPEKGD